MGKAKQRVFVEFDQEWLSEIVGRGVQDAIDGYSRSLESMVSQEITKALEYHVTRALQSEARKALKERIGSLK